MNGKQLKNSILQWAIQGRLVPQDPNDEPASVLLEKIRQEKERLIKDKKIKRDKNASVIFRGDDNSYYEKVLATGEVKCIDEEIPFDLPNGWEWCRIRNICSMQAGKNISASMIHAEKSDNNPYRCVGGNGLRGYTSIFNTDGNFAIIGRQGALCGCMNLENGKFYATEHAVVVDSYGLISALFIYYFFIALNLNQYATATAQPGLAVSNILEVLIPLPPLPEQRRIVAKLQELEPLIEQYGKSEEALCKLNATIAEKLKKSILQEAIQGRLVPQIESEGSAADLLQQIKEEKQRLVKEGKLKKSALTDSVIFRGDDNKYYEQVGKTTRCINDEIPFDLPPSWRWCRMKELGIIETGTTPPKSHPEYFGNSIPFYGPGNIQDNAIVSCTQGISEKGIPLCRLVAANTILQVCIGGSIGKAAITNKESAFNQQINSLSVFNPLSVKYIFNVLITDIFRQQILDKATGTATPIINRGNWETLFIPLPPLPEQRRIVAKIEELSATLGGIA